MVKRIAILLLLAALLIPAGALLAMESTHYRLAWFTPLTGSGGTAATSTNYAVNLTVGQSAIGTASSTAMTACLGYWCGESTGVLYLPVVLNAGEDAE